MGARRRRMALTRLKTAVLAPIPSVRESRATSVKPGRLRARRSATRRSLTIDGTAVSLCSRRRYPDIRPGIVSVSAPEHATRLRWGRGGLQLANKRRERRWIDLDGTEP